MNCCAEMLCVYLQIYSAMLFFAGANDICELQSIAREVCTLFVLFN